MQARTATSPRGADPASGDRSDASGVGVVLRAGERLGDYHLLAPIAAGGMARVWAAARNGEYGFRRLVAIKVMREEIAGDPAFRRMFLDEGRLAARIRHTNVVEVLAIGEQGGTVYHVMPLVEGDSLSRLLRALEDKTPGAKAPFAVAVRIVVDALRGLHEAHETTGDDGVPLGIVHRDVSPQNILVGVDGVAKIADFGIAKAIGSLAEETRTGEFRGKVSYVSPEHLRKAKVDRRSDVFSVGVVLWELLAGLRLTPAAATTLIAGESLDDPRAHDATIPAPIAAVVMRALAAATDARFATADAMADALEAAARESGLDASTKGVATWVRELVVVKLERRRTSIEEAVSASARDDATTPSRARKIRLAAMTAALVLVTSSLVALAYLRGAVPAASSIASAAPRSASEAPAGPTGPAGSIAAAAPATSAEGLASASASVAAPAVGTGSVAASADAGAPSRSRAAPPRRTRDFNPRPKFGNPYSQ